MTSLANTVTFEHKTVPTCTIHLKIYLFMIFTTYWQLVYCRC